VSSPSSESRPGGGGSTLALEKRGGGTVMTCAFRTGRSSSSIDDTMLPRTLRNLGDLTDIAVANSEGIEPWSDSEAIVESRKLHCELRLLESCMGGSKCGSCSVTVAHEPLAVCLRTTGYFTTSGSITLTSNKLPMLACDVVGGLEVDLWRIILMTEESDTLEYATDSLDGGVIGFRASGEAFAVNGESKDSDGTSSVEA
jgi:hypothetical protein